MRVAYSEGRHAFAGSERRPAGAPSTGPSGGCSVDVASNSPLTGTLSRRASVYRVDTDGRDLPFSICEIREGETSACRASSRNDSPAACRSSLRRGPSSSMDASVYVVSAPGIPRREDGTVGDGTAEVGTVPSVTGTTMSGADSLMSPPVSSRAHDPARRVVPKRNFPGPSPGLERPLTARRHPLAGRQARQTV